VVTSQRWKAVLKLTNNLTIPLPRGRGIYKSLTVVMALLIMAVTFFNGEEDLPDTQPMKVRATQERKVTSVNPLIKMPTRVTRQTFQEDNIKQAELPLIEWYAELGQIQQIEDATTPASERILQLQEWLISADPVIKLAALESIGSFNHPDSVNVFINALYDADTIIRIKALEGLAEHADKQSAIYIEPLLFDADNAVREAAINAIADIGATDLIAALLSLVSDPNRKVRLAAVAAIEDMDRSRLQDLN